MCSVLEMHRRAAPAAHSVGDVCRRGCIVSRQTKARMTYVRQHVRPPCYLKRRRRRCRRRRCRRRRRHRRRRRRHRRWRRRRCRHRRCRHRRPRRCRRRRRSCRRRRRHRRPQWLSETGRLAYIRALRGGRVTNMCSRVGPVQPIDRFPPVIILHIIKFRLGGPGRLLPMQRC